MSGEERVLDSDSARAYYDRFAKKQDAQGFYEDPALDDLVAHANFPDARRAFEFGCGTGKFGARLLKQHLPSSASYLGCDISPTMVGLARSQLEAFSDRAQVVLTDGTVRFPLPDRSVDRVVCSYVLDLLSEANIRLFYSEARRVLMPGGLLCIASLTEGVGIPSRIVSWLWRSIFRLNPAIVGGCRPILIHAFVNSEEWQVVHRKVVTPFGVPSEVLVLKTKDAPDSGSRSTSLRGTTRPSR